MPLLGRKVMSNLESILKSRDITLLSKIHVVKAMVFPVVMYGCKSWTIKKTECQRINAFELWFWRRLFRVPWAARRSNQSEINARSTQETQEIPWVGKVTWRRAWQPTPVLLLGKSHGWRRLADYSSWGCRVGHN